VLRKHAHGSDHSAGTIAFVLVISTVVVSSSERKIQSCEQKEENNLRRRDRERRLVIIINIGGFMNEKLTSLSHWKMINPMRPTIPFANVEVLGAAQATLARLR
jgi:hypothetical protein